MEQHRIRWNGWGLTGRADTMPDGAWRWLSGAFAMPALLATPPRELCSLTLPASRLSEDAVSRLAAIASVRQDDFSRAAHSARRDGSDLLRLRAGDVSGVPDAVLYPRSEEQVLAILKLCAEAGIAVSPFGHGAAFTTPSRGDHGAVIVLDLSALSRVTSVDAVSGLAEAEAGITGPELERQLAARGMTLGHAPDSFEFSTLGGWIASDALGQDAARYGLVSDWLAAARLATPQGLLTPAGMPDLTQLLAGSRGALGVITRATIRIRGLPAAQEHRGYLFPDFASGLAAIRETQRTGLPHTMLRLSDDGETRFARAIARAGHPWDVPGRLFDAWLAMRRFDGKAAQMLAGFAGGVREVRDARQAFDMLAKRSGALALGAERNWAARRFADFYRRDTLLDRGVGVGHLTVTASWAQLPSLYVGVRAALRAAMRAQVPRPGAHGLVLCHVGGAWPDRASLRFSWLYPRRLNDDAAQALAIEKAGRAAATEHGAGALEAEALRGLKSALDPKGILNPGRF
jgi:alkyldihydroxyacetonephosphate synthase